MRPIVFALSGILLLAPAIVAAQQFSSLEERMTYNEFRAAGLEKLSPEELAALNAWLRKDLPAVAAAAVSTAALPVADRRGFPVSASNQGPAGDIVSRIPGEFRGWSNKQRFTLENGQVWQVNDSAASLAGVRLQDPQVTISRGLVGGWYLAVEGYNSRAKVKRIK
ncbi:MAG: hypothetical protein COW59_11870 [Lysobacterales bacterium CG17_big_fil_post_rev_8_21_14_2_50_64_11]|nr:MAG: hypothetical protein COW59_11870 [Xanthomonadales bacterium CG17_big_fil_post_rev_8_21_14_2_50_64_11]PIX59892.1 MAG: hypothetical protein COZ47_10045 [Xanthomonadales bacterium CG_4_10_14_3_um_filter_64_11]